MKLIYKWIIFSIGVYVSSLVIVGIHVDPIWVALVVGACITFINMVVKPILHFFTMPINIITLGFFHLVVNGALYWALGLFIKGFTVENLTAAILGSIVISILAWLLQKIIGEQK